MTKDQIVNLIEEMDQWVNDFGYLTDTAGYRCIRRFWMTKLKFLEYRKPKVGLKKIKHKA